MNPESNLSNTHSGNNPEPTKHAESPRPKYYIQTAREYYQISQDLLVYLAKLSKRRLYLAERGHIDLEQDELKRIAFVLSGNEDLIVLSEERGPALIKLLGHKRLGITEAPERRGPSFVWNDDPL